MALHRYLLGIYDIRARASTHIIAISQHSHLRIILMNVDKIKSKIYGVRTVPKKDGIGIGSVGKRGNTIDLGFQMWLPMWLLIWLPNERMLQQQY